jgi:hypothetical protein
VDTLAGMETDDGLLIRYLLGDLADDERDRLQQAYFEDEDLFARLLAAEDDLIDAYVSGSLTEAERDRFEQRFGRAPRHQRRLEFARLLRRAGEARALRAAPRAHWSISRAAAAAVLFAVIGLAWWAGHRERPPTSSASQTPRPSISAESGSEGTALPTAVASVVLRAGMVRGAGRAPELVLAPSIGWAELQLELDPDVRNDSRYEAVVETADGTQVARVDGLTQAAGSAPLVTIRVPAPRLTQKDYVVLLSRTSADGTRVFVRGYAFQVTRTSEVTGVPSP